MSNVISITVPQDAAILAMAAKFLGDVAEQVRANPETPTADTVGPEHAIDPVEDDPIAEPTPEPEIEAAAPEQEPQPLDVKRAFSPAPSIFAEPEPEPEYQMTEAAEGFTREQHHASGWTDDALIAAGRMAVIVKTPAAPVAAAPAPSNAPTPPGAITPTAPASTPAPPSSAGTVSAGTPAPDLDSEGLPWDSRIHASTKTRMKSDGTWKLKRGVSDAEVQSVKDQLRQLQGNAPVKAPAPAAATAEAPAADKPGAALMRRITAAFASKTLDNRTVLEAIRHPSVGLQEVRELCQPQNAHLVPIAEKLMFGE